MLADDVVFNTETCCDLLNVICFFRHFYFEMVIVSYFWKEENKTDQYSSEILPFVIGVRASKECEGRSLPPSTICISLKPSMRELGWEGINQLKKTEKGSLAFPYWKLKKC